MAAAHRRKAANAAQAGYMQRTSCGTAARPAACRSAPHSAAAACHCRMRSKMAGCSPCCCCCPSCPSCPLAASAPGPAAACCASGAPVRPASMRTWKQAMAAAMAADTSGRRSVSQLRLSPGRNSSTRPLSYSTWGGGEQVGAEGGLKERGARGQQGERAHAQGSGSGSGTRGGPCFSLPPPAAAAPPSTAAHPPGTWAPGPGLRRAGRCCARPAG